MEGKEKSIKIIRSEVAEKEAEERRRRENRHREQTHTHTVRAEHKNLQMKAF